MRLVTLSFSKMRCRCTLTVPSVRPSSVAISLLRSPRWTSATMLAFARRKLLERVAPATRRLREVHCPLHDFLIEPATALDDGFEGTAASHAERSP